MLDTLYAKTFSVLGGQLFLTWVVAVCVIQWVRVLYQRGTPGIYGRLNSYGQLDLDIDPGKLKRMIFPLAIGNIGVFLALLFWGKNYLVPGLVLFSIWSALTGVKIALALISVDENLGSKVLGITAIITFICALIGMKSGADFGGLQTLLFWGLIGLFAINVLRMFMSISSGMHRIIAGFGVALFTGYLLYDFNRLAKASAVEAYNSWPVAIQTAISIYLDIINLFLYLLDLLSR